GIRDGIVYLQVTRGAAPRDFAFPKSARPSLVVTSRRMRIADPRLIETGIAVITLPDIRWKRPDIKSVALLPNAMEGTSSNAWIVTAKDEVVTRKADDSILNGVTRLGLLDIIAREGMRFVERPFSVAEAKAAREAMLTSATNGVLPVVKIDGKPVGQGKPGKLALKLAAAYRDFMDGAA